MKASMWMMHDALENRCIQTHLDSSADAKNIRGVLPYQAKPSDDVPTALAPDQLYVVDATGTGLPENSAVSASQPVELPDGPVNMVVIGQYFAMPNSSSCQFFVIDAPLGLTEAFAAVCLAFQDYESWAGELQAELNGNRDLNAICEIGVEKLDNPLMLYDRDYLIIANSQLPADSAMLGYIERVGAFYMTRQELIGQLQRTKSFQETFQTQGGQLYDCGGEDMSVYVNLSLTKEYEGRLVIGCQVRGPKRGDYQLAEIVTDAIRVALSGPTLHHNDIVQFFHIYLATILDGEASPGRQLSGNLELWGWPRIDKYICVHIGLSEHDAAISVDQFICSQVETAIPEACAIRYHKGIACVVRLADGETPESVSEKLMAALRDVVGCIAESEPFEDVLEAGEHYKQAKVAAEMGTRDHPDEWCHRFEDYAMAHYFEHGTSVLPAINFCDHDVRNLMQYRGARVDYYETLKAYLENDMNLLKTADVLCIHRTTLFNRIKRIRELVSADLDNPTDRVRLLISFTMMDAAERYSAATPASSPGACGASWARRLPYGI